MASFLCGTSATALIDQAKEASLVMASALGQCTSVAHDRFLQNGL